MKPLSISIAILSIMCSGCITPITLHTGLKKNKIDKKTIVWEQTLPSAFFGLLTFRKIDAIKKCEQAQHNSSKLQTKNNPSQSKRNQMKVTKLEIKRSIPNFLVLLLTLGLYTPFKVRILCQVEK